MSILSDLPAILNKLVDYERHSNPAIHEHLQPPQTLEALEQLKPFSYQLPTEVLTLYQWHNGTKFNDSNPWEELFYYHRFLPFEESVAEYRELQRLGKGTHNPHLFPLFAFMGEYYSVWCNRERQMRSPIYFVYHGEVQAYDNLGTMLCSILECYEVGAYTLVDNIYQPNEPLVAEIKLKWNQCRMTTNGALGYHP